MGDPSSITIDLPAEFGQTLVDAQPAYSPGEEVTVRFVSGYPGNDLKTMASYAYVERKLGGEGWEVVATDRDSSLLFIWNHSANFVETEAHISDSSNAEIVWTMPRNAVMGTYRVRHEGVFRASRSAPPEACTGMSWEFSVAGPQSECP